MDALAERCFQLDANRQMRRLKERVTEQRLHARARGSDREESGCRRLLAAAVIALVLVVVLTVIGVEFWAGFVLSIILAVLSVFFYKVRMDSGAGRPGATAGELVQRWKLRRR